MRFSKREQLVLNMIKALYELEQAEQDVKERGGHEVRMAMVAKHDAFTETERAAIQEFADLESLEYAVESGMVFFKYLKQI